MLVDLGAEGGERVHPYEARLHCINWEKNAAGVRTDRSLKVLEVVKDSA